MGDGPSDRNPSTGLKLPELEESYDETITSQDLLETKTEAAPDTPCLHQTIETPQRRHRHARVGLREGLGGEGQSNAEYLGVRMTETPSQGLIRLDWSGRVTSRGRGGGLGRVEGRVR